MGIIDFHTHAFPDSLAPRAMASLVAGAEDYPPHHDGTISGLLRRMDEAGIEKAIICSIATKPGQERPILDWSKAIMSERIVPFISLHPTGSASDHDVLLDEAVEAGIKGVKFHCMYQNFPVDDETAIAMYMACAERNLIVLFHAGYDICWPDSDLASPKRLRNALDRVPNLRMVAAHTGGWYMWDDVVEYLAGGPLYLDTSFTFGMIEGDALNKIWELHPHDRILFGTDSPWADQRKELQNLREFIGRGEEFMRIVSGNAHEILGLDSD